MPSLNHAGAQMNRGFLFKQQNTFSVFSELDLELDGVRYTPDLSVYPKRQPDWSQDVIRETNPPLTTVEIFSPKQGYEDVMQKVVAYLDAGVKTCWVLVPPLRTITIYHPGKPPETFSTGMAVDSATGLRAEVAEVFT